VNVSATADLELGFSLPADMVECMAEGLVDAMAAGTELLTSAEVARLAGISTNQVTELTRRGRLASVQPGGRYGDHRYRRADVAAFLTARWSS